MNHISKETLTYYGLVAMLLPNQAPFTIGSLEAQV
jgi:hypothetical protein